MENNERFSYIESDFLGENLRLRRTPENTIECANKLACLAENNYRRNPHYKPFEYCAIKRSKRYNRIIKMFWAFYKTEGRENMRYILDAPASVSKM